MRCHQAKFYFATNEIIHDFHDGFIVYGKAAVLPDLLDCDRAVVLGDSSSERFIDDVFESAKNVDIIGAPPRQFIEPAVVCPEAIVYDSKNFEGS